MTKAEIVAAVYDRVGGFSKKEATDLVETLFETLKETLGRGEKIKIAGFGNLIPRDKASRRGRNPQTGETLMITERRVLTFKASQLLRDTLNGETPQNASKANHSRSKSAERVVELAGKREPDGG